MTEEQAEMMMDMARRVMQENNPSQARQDWADDVMLALGFGDIKAARRIGILDNNGEKNA